MSNKLATCAIVIGIICFLAVTADAASISFNVLDDYIQVGEEFKVEVYAQDETDSLGDLLSFGFDIDDSLNLFAYNPPATLDEAFEDEGSKGYYVTGSYKLGQDGNAGENVRLAELSFTAGDAVGTEDLSISGLYDIFEFRGLFYEFDDPFVGQDIAASVSISINSAPVPEPATILLVSFGAIGFFGLRKKTTHNPSV